MQGGAGGMGQPKFGGVGGRGGRVFVEAKEGKLSWLLFFNQKLPRKRLLKIIVKIFVII